jgi:hypothetical protein
MANWKWWKEIMPNDLLKVYVITSSGYGIGIVIGESFDTFRWGTWELDVGMKIRAVGTAGSVAVNPPVFALMSDLSFFCGRHFLVRSNNQAVVGEWKKRNHGIRSGTR